ncbi:MAG: MFS transporter BCD family chlorophyll transporter [Anaerolineaceae bacterium]|nr:MAG: MFS transporter BCD family chlorophyll transporter [Anaerolineaceae bacterium]
MLLKRLQLGLIHAAVAMTLVPINSTLNRVMIKELALSATLVAVLASLPYLFSPIQVAIGSYSDRHPIFGLRRTPYILLGLLLCVAGVIVSPQVAFLFAQNWWLGLALGVLAFGAWGMGFNFASVSYLALASEISGEKGRGRTIAVMFFIMIVGIILTALSLAHMIDPYTPQALQRAFQIVGGMALILGLLGLIGLEKRAEETSRAEHYSLRQMAQAIVGNSQARIFFVYLWLLLVALLGQDVLLEPFGGEAFGLPVQATTSITAIWGGCMLAALSIGGVLEGRLSKRVIAQAGNVGALAAFVLIAISGLIASVPLFYAGVILLGLGTGLSTVANLSLMLDMSTPASVGLFIGAWGMSNAFSRLSGSILGGVVRDAVAQLTQNPVLGYVAVFGIEAGLMLAAVFLLRRINPSAFRQKAEQMSYLEAAALAAEN